MGREPAEHNYAGIQQVLVDERFWMWRAWDGIRALDYLMSRKEVDVRHLGVTGNSGGGTMTTWLCGVEDRWTMAAPSCFVTEFRRNMENELGADMEQCPPRALALGLDHEDFLAALAPKPVIILAKEKDYFDARGNEAAYHRLKGLYRLLGAEDNIAYFVGPTYHGYSQENREAMYRWFNRCTGISDARTEPKLVLEKDETFWCTPRGQVAELSRRRFTASRRRSRGRSRRSGSISTARRSSDGCRSASSATTQRRSGISNSQAAARSEVSDRHALPYMVETDPACTRLCTGSRRSRCSRVRHETPTRPSCTSRTHPQTKSFAASGSFGISSRPIRCGVLCVRRARRRRFRAPDNEPERPRRIQHRLFLCVARAHAGLPLCRSADV